MHAREILAGKFPKVLANTDCEMALLVVDENVSGVIIVKIEKKCDGIGILQFSLFSLLKQDCSLFGYLSSSTNLQVAIFKRLGLTTLQIRFFSNPKHKKGKY